MGDALLVLGPRIWLFDTSLLYELKKVRDVERTFFCSRRRISFSGPGIVGCSRCRNSFEIFQDVESPYLDPEFFARDVKTCSRVFKMSNLNFEILNRLFFEMSKLVRDFSRHRITLFGIRNNLFEMLKLVQEF